MVRRFSSLEQSDAATIAAACVAEARRIGIAVCVAVSDRPGALLHFVRMDDAPLLSISIAQDKAYSVAAFNGLPTDAWWGLIEGDGALEHGLVKTDRLIVFGGGAPCLVDGELCGAVGVSGGSAEQDTAIARLGASTFA